MPTSGLPGVTGGPARGVPRRQLLLAGAASLVATPALAAARPPRIFHVMSYHSPWRWTDGQWQGFRDALALPEAEVRVFQMNAKVASGAEQKEAAGRTARALIDTWQPDLLYASDDEAQEHVGRHYAGGRMPVVFSGVNKAPAAHGYEGAANVAGVLEHEHALESVRLVQSLAPRVRRFAAVFDDAPLWPSVRQRMQARLAGEPGVEFVAWDTIRTFAEYKRRLAEYQGEVDALALIGIFNFKDGEGRNVPYQDVQRYTVEASRLPDFSFWIDRIHYGTLAAVTVSEREQGLAAGRIARAILVERRSPASLAITPTLKGLPAISLARARRLGLQVKSSQLLSATVLNRFEWDR